MAAKLEETILKSRLKEGLKGALGKSSPKRLEIQIENKIFSKIA
jgi:hypothetical protein